MKTWKVIKDCSEEEIRNAIKASTTFTGALNILRMNPNGKNRKILRDYCKEKSIPVNNLIQKQTREEYEKNPKLCKHCGKPIPWKKRENSYCCRSCSASESNIKRAGFSGKIKIKISYLMRRGWPEEELGTASIVLESGEQNHTILLK